VKRRNRFEDLGIEGGDIKINLKKIMWENVDCIHLAQERDQ
jgi:hypothetical protein